MALSTTFNALHQQSAPLFLANCWDPSSALIIEQAGGQAVATTSWGMSNHQGYKDGEQLTFNRVLQTVSAILKVITIPLSVDIEAGYSADQNQIIKHIIQLADLGVAGINIEDKPSHQSSLRDIRHTKHYCRQSNKLYVMAVSIISLLMPVVIFAYNHSGRKRRCMSVHSPIKQQVAMAFLFPV